MIVYNILRQSKISHENRSDELKNLQHFDSKLNIRKTQEISQMNSYKNQIISRSQLMRI